MKVVTSSSGVETTVMEQVEMTCPPFGVECDGGMQSYLGGVWHDPQVAIPNCTQSDTGGEETCTNMYVCVLNGCPEEGATEMRCKDGYEDSSPLCALCSDGYFQSVRDCARCERAKIGELVAFVLGVLMLITLLLFLVRKYHCYLDRAAAFSRACCI
jgi:hypothetical protein